MTYAPPKNGQYEPVTATSSKDCVAATAAMLVERAVVGRIRPTHAAIRAASGAPATRGLYLWEAAFAAKKLYGLTLTPLLGLSRNAVRDTVAGGSAVGVTIHTAVTRYTSRRTNYYVGPHEVHLHYYQWWRAGQVCQCEKASAAAHGEYLVEDPGTTAAGYLWWSAELVYLAAERLTGGNGINLLVAQDTEAVTRKARLGVLLRKEPSMTAPTLSGGNTVVGTGYAVISTANGGPWKRPDGTIANGWHRIRRGTQTGWVRGEALA